VIALTSSSGVAAIRVGTNPSPEYRKTNRSLSPGPGTGLKKPVSALLSAETSRVARSYLKMLETPV
jgi:hypothetical protein